MYVRASFSSLFEAQIKTDAVSRNRRASTRKKTCELAEIVVDLKGRRIACLVHNVSDGGAMIESSCDTLPKRFVLAYPARNIHKVCHVVWSCGALRGLEFVCK